MRFKYAKYITEPWQFEIDPLHLRGMGTRYSTLGVGQSYIMLRVFEDADNNPFAAILQELDPPCPHATSCAHSWPPTQGDAEAQEMPKIDFGMAV